MLQHDLHALCHGSGRLTHYPVDPFRFVPPPNTHEVNGDSCQHDDHSQAADHRFRVEAEAQQHSPKQHVGNGDQHVHLHEETKA